MLLLISHLLLGPVRDNTFPRDRTRLPGPVCFGTPKPNSRTSIIRPKSHLYRTDLSRSRHLGNAGAARRHVPRRDFSGPHFLTAGATHAGWVAAAQPPAGVANCPRRPSWFRRLAVHPRIKRANSAVQPCGLFSAAPGTANGEGRGQEPETNSGDRVAGEIGDSPAGALNPRQGEVRSSSALQLASHLASRRVSACSAAPRYSQTAHGHKLSPVLLPIVWGTITLPSHSHIVFKCIW